MSNPIRPPILNPDGTIQILLTRGQIAVVDAVDADLSMLNWCAVSNPRYLNKKPCFSAGHSRYLGNGKEKREYLHQIILARILGRDLLKGEEVDHIDNDPLNNLRSNLRLANRSQNNFNQGLKSTNTSGFKGVIRHKGRWVAQISAYGKFKRLGSFDTPEEAYTAYCAAAAELHGEFANLGEIRKPAPVISLWAVGMRAA